jgi:hypothetical protein
MQGLVLDAAALLMLAIAIVAPCIEAYSQRRWPRATLLPSGVAMIIALLLLAIA